MYQNTAAVQEGGGQADQVRHDKQMGHYAASWTRQFAVLAKRHLLGQLRNPTDSSSRLLMSCYVGLLAGTPCCSHCELARLQDA